MPTSTYDKIVQLKREHKKAFTVLVDPDKTTLKKADELIARCIQANVDFIFVGGSLVVSDHLEELVQHIKASCDIPVLLFPSSPSQVTPYADALLYLSLISGRNAEYLIGQHVISAPIVKKSGLEVIPTGYMVVDGGAPTTVSYISNASAIPSNKNEIARKIYKEILSVDKLNFESLYFLGIIEGIENNIELSIFYFKNYRSNF